MAGAKQSEASDNVSAVPDMGLTDFAVTWSMRWRRQTMGTTMLAGRMNFATGTFAVKQVPVPVPAPGEVRVRVRAAGICLTDVHYIEGVLERPPLLSGGDELTL